MPAQTHCAGKTGDKRRSPASLSGRVWNGICRLSLRGTPLGSAQDGWGPLAAGEGPAPQAFFSVYHTLLQMQGLQVSLLSVGCLPPGDALPAGGFFLLPERNQRPPKAGPSPALWNPPRGTGCPCVLLFAALGLAGSHRWIGNSTEYTCFSET